MDYSKIYTKRGDSGTTSLWNGDRVPKDDSRIIAVGSIDSLSLQIGSLHIVPEFKAYDLIAAEQIQYALIDIMGAIAYSPKKEGEGSQHASDVISRIPNRLEFLLDQIDAAAKELDQATGGQVGWTIYGKGGSHALLYDAIGIGARNAEVELVKVKNSGITLISEDIILKYFNALSKYFYLKARQYALLFEEEDTSD